MEILGFFALMLGVLIDPVVIILILLTGLIPKKPLYALIAGLFVGLVWAAVWFGVIVPSMHYKIRIPTEVVFALFLDIALGSYLLSLFKYLVKRAKRIEAGNTAQAKEQKQIPLPFENVIKDKAKVASPSDKLNDIYFKYYSAFNVVAKISRDRQTKLYLEYFVFFAIVESHENWYETDSPEDVLFKAFRIEFFNKQKDKLKTLDSKEQKTIFIEAFLFQRAIQEDYVFINNCINQEGKTFQQLENNIRLWSASWYIFDQNILNGGGGIMGSKDFNNAMTALRAHWSYYGHETF